MSYEIIYDKQFIKVEKDGKEQFCPILLAGSNNCYDYNNKRSRSWQNWNYFLKGEAFGTLEEMLQIANEHREEKIQSNKRSNEENIKNGRPEWNDEYDDSRWGYFTALSMGGGCQTTFGQYIGIFKTGCKKAVTVEQLLENCGNLRIESSYRADEKLKEFGKEAFVKYPKTSEEFVQMIAEVEEYIKGTETSYYISISGGDEIAKRIRSRLFPKTKRVKVRHEVDSCFIIMEVTKGLPVVKNNRNSFSYGYRKDSAKKFLTEKDAKRYAKRMNDKFRSYKFEVEEVFENAIIYA